MNEYTQMVQQTKENNTEYAFFMKINMQANYLLKHFSIFTFEIVSTRQTVKYFHQKNLCKLFTQQMLSKINQMSNIKLYHDRCPQRLHQILLKNKKLTLG